MIFALIGSILFGLIVIFYLLLVFGVPLGEYAMGGQQKVLSGKNRVAVALAIILQIFGIFALLQTGGLITAVFSYGIIKISCYVFAIYLSINVVMNIFSKSHKERWMMTPLSFIIAVCYWIVISEM